MYTHVYIHTYIHTCIYTHTCTYIYIYMYIGAAAAVFLAQKPESDTPTGMITITIQVLGYCYYY